MHIPKQIYEQTMYHTNLKKQVEGMEKGDAIRPNRGYKEITLRNYASMMGKELGRTYSVRREGNTLTIIRTA